MSALPKHMAESYATASQPAVKDAHLIRFPQNEIIRRRQYAAQMEMSLACKARDVKQTGCTKLQHQPR